MLKLSSRCRIFQLEHTPAMKISKLLMKIFECPRDAVRGGVIIWWQLLINFSLAATLHCGYLGDIRIWVPQEVILPIFFIVVLVSVFDKILTTGLDKCKCVKNGINGILK